MSAAEYVMADGPARRSLPAIFIAAPLFGLMCGWFALKSWVLGMGALAALAVAAVGLRSPSRCWAAYLGFYYLAASYLPLGVGVPVGWGLLLLFITGYWRVRWQAASPIVWGDRVFWRWFTAWLAWAWLCVMLSSEPSEGVKEVGRYTISAVILLTYLNWLNAESTLRSAIRMVSAIALMVSALFMGKEILQRVFHASVPLTGILPLGLGELGVLLAALLPVLVSPWVLAAKQPTRRQAWGLGLMALTLFGITQSRSAALSAILGVFVLFSFRWSPRTRTKVFWGFGLGAVIALLLVWWSEPVRALAVYAMSGRHLVWAAALQAIAEHPLIGIGPAGWESWFGQHFLSVDFLMHDLYGNTFFLSPSQLGGEAHNLLLTKAAEMGLPSAIGLVALLWAWFRGAVRSAHALRPGFGRWVALGGIASMAGLAAHCFLENGPIIGRARGAEMTIVWFVAALPFAAARIASNLRAGGAGS